MSRKFGEIEQSERLYTKSDLEGFIAAVDALPDVNSVDAGLCRFLLKYQKIGEIDYVPGKIYIVRVWGGVKKWMDIAVTDMGSLAAPTNFWKRITSDSIILRWTDPSDVAGTSMLDKATWDHDVIVRKLGAVPQNPDDGEVVGYSSVRNQYSSDDCFGFIHPISSTDAEYRYRVFAVTKGGKYTGTDESLVASWTWDEIAQQIGTGDTISRYEKVFKIGDVFPMPYHEEYGTIYAEIVDFKYSVNSSGSNPPSITFMTKSVLGCDDDLCGGMSFNDNEFEYAPTGDSVFKKHKKYFVYRNGSLVEYNWKNLYSEGETIPTSQSISKDGYVRFDIYEENPSIRYFKNDSNVQAMSLTASELNSQLYMSSGRGAWLRSALSIWLSSDYRDSTNSVEKNALSFDGYAERTTGPILDSNGYTANYYGWYDTVDLNPNDIDWNNPRNGWFLPQLGEYHKIAPWYINHPVFPSGFATDPDDEGYSDAMSFLSQLMTVKNRTITDQYVDRKTRSSTDDTSTTGVVAYRDIPNARFWIPSYEEIFGTRPVYGHNGMLSTANVNGVHEGTRFKLFDPTYNKNYRQARIRYDMNGDPCAYWTRSVDPTSPGRVYYVDSGLPENDVSSSVNLTAAANGTSDDKVIGTVVCFTLFGKNPPQCLITDRKGNEICRVAKGSQYPLDVLEEYIGSSIMNSGYKTVEITNAEDETTIAYKSSTSTHLVMSPGITNSVIRDVAVIISVSTKYR